jgi:Zn-dependent M28 family amino/carboxypeptidase
MAARAGGGSEIMVERETAEPGLADLAHHIATLTASAAGEVMAGLVFRGFGMVDEDRGWDDYGPIRVEGSIVMVIEGEPQPPHSEEAGPSGQAGETIETPHGPTVLHGGGWGSTASTFHKLMNARRRGAVAVLLAPHPDRLDEAMPSFDPASDVRAGIPALAISADLARLLVPDYEARARKLAAADAAHEVEAARVTGVQRVKLKADVVRAKGTATNVLGLLRGSEADGPIVVVGAHFDHLGHGGSGSLAPGDYGTVHNGADDNASGTACVLELARRMKEQVPPRGDVLFALWSGEELGLLGSSHWVDHATLPLERVIANLNLDMVGRAGAGKCSILGVGTSPAFEAWMEEAGSASGLRLEASLSGIALGGSDHQSFLKKGIPALHLFTGLHADYHRPSDDVERFEAAGAARVVALSLDLVQRCFTAAELPFVDPSQLAGGGGSDQPGGGRWSVRFGSMPDYAYEGEGLRLTGTSPGGPAERAGLLGGDVLLQVGDVEITSIHDFMYALQIYKPGDVVLTRFLRDGEEEHVRVTLEAAGG